MIIKNETKFGRYFKLPNPSLRSYFDRVVRGQPDEYRTTFYKGLDVSEVLANWMPHLEVLKREWPSLFDFENDLAGKVGPMSIMKPLAERMEDIEHYYADVQDPGVAISPLAINAVIQEFSGLRGLRLRSQQNTVGNMKLSTSSGSPFFTKGKRRVVGQTIPCSIRQLNNTNADCCMNLPDDNRYLAAAILGWRGQEGGPDADDVKQRVVWMFPFAVNVEELRLYQPLIEGAQRLNLVPAWISMEAVDERITKLFDTKSPDDLIVCTDFSKFDQHFNCNMQKCAQSIIEHLISGEDAHSWLNNVFPIKYSIPLAFNWGEIRYGLHGMASGSGGTNADETLSHRALQYEAAQSVGQILNPNSMCLGDDGILTYPGITVEDVTRTYSSHGQEMNIDKQYASAQDCTYLRRWHHRDYRDKKGICVGVYSTCRALGRLAEQERYYDPEIWSKEMVALRQLSILENVKHHPLREEFVDYCMKGDKYRLGLDIPGFLTNIESYAKKATEYMPDFLGYTKSMQKGAEIGISNWWIVQYLKSKA